MLHCNKCHKDFSLKEVKKLKAGLSDIFMCPKCEGPCFEVTDKKQTESKTLLNSKSNPNWMKWGAIVVGIIVFLCLLIPQAYLQWESHKSRKRLTEKFEKQKTALNKKIEEKGENINPFDVLEVMEQ